MNKKEWVDAMARVVDNLETAIKNLKVAEKNVEIVKGQIEESEFMIIQYREKIKTFK